MNFLSWFRRKRKKQVITPLYTSYRRMDEEQINAIESSFPVYNTQDDNTGYSYPSYTDNDSPSDFGGGESGGAGADGSWDGGTSD